MNTQHHAAPGRAQKLERLACDPLRTTTFFPAAMVPSVVAGFENNLRRLPQKGNFRCPSIATASLLCPPKPVNFGPAVVAGWRINAHLSIDALEAVPPRLRGTREPIQ